MELSQQNITAAKNWLSQKALPLWTGIGFEEKTGCFIESITFEGQALTNADRRAMVQCRQIYSVCEGAKLGLIDHYKAAALIKKNTDLLISKYKLPSKGYAQTINANLEISNNSIELYTQAFVIFGLAQAYALLKTENLKTEALSLLEYLNSQRRNNEGGYTEIKSGQTLFQSNPHMHLLEAALAWVAVDDSPEWKKLSKELKDLCLNHFIDKETNLLAEHFSKPWQPMKEENGFIFEPGHHYEWSWLFLEYSRLMNENLEPVSKILFDQAEKNSLIENGTIAVDEVWSNLKINKSTARFWPQGERIKAAVSLGKLEKNTEKKAEYYKSADLAFEGLYAYVQTPVAGLSYDSKLENGNFKQEPAAKASSLYHIINAFSEYIIKRE